MRASIDPGLDGLTEKIIGGAFAVSNGLGHGFLEAVYKMLLWLNWRPVNYPSGRSNPFLFIIVRSGLGFTLRTSLSRIR